MTIHNALQALLPAAYALNSSLSAMFKGGHLFLHPHSPRLPAGERGEWVVTARGFVGGLACSNTYSVQLFYCSKRQYSCYGSCKTECMQDIPYANNGVDKNLATFPTLIKSIRSQLFLYTTGSGANYMILTSRVNTVVRVLNEKCHCQFYSTK